MRCIYCGKEMAKFTLVSIFIKDDELCTDCRMQLKLNKKKINLGTLEVETLYNYDEGIFKELLIQYKECYDEALADVFLYLLDDYIRLKYHGYKILCVPSSEEKIRLRGFNHLEVIYGKVGLKRLNGLKMKEQLVQEGKNLKQRKMMINNYIYEGESVNKVLIVDDVLTSGSSMLGVYNAIKPYANKVKALSLARKENAFI